MQKQGKKYGNLHKGFNFGTSWNNNEYLRCEILQNAPHLKIKKTTFQRMKFWKIYLDTCLLAE